MRSVIFDFNGTLFYDTDKHIIAWQRYLERHHCRVPTEKEAQETIIGTTNTTILRRYVDDGITPEQVIAAVEQKEELYFEACRRDPDCMHLTAGAEAFFDLLTARGIPFMIATGSAKQNMDFYFEHLPIGRWFSYDNVIYDDYSRKGKPYPDIYLDAAGHLGTPIGECVVFEDALAGYRSAEAAGAGAIVMVGTPENTAGFEKLPAVTEIIRDFREPEALLARLGLIH